VPRAGVDVYVSAAIRRLAIDHRCTSAGGEMRLILNVIWLIFGGLWLALGYPWQR